MIDFVYINEFDFRVFKGDKELKTIGDFALSLNTAGNYKLNIETESVIKEEKPLLTKDTVVIQINSDGNYNVLVDFKVIPRVLAVDFSYCAEEDHAELKVLVKNEIFNEEWKSKNPFPLFVNLVVSLNPEIGRIVFPSYPA